MSVLASEEGRVPLFPVAGSKALVSPGLIGVFSGNTVLPLAQGALCVTPRHREQGEQNAAR